MARSSTTFKRGNKSNGGRPKRGHTLREVEKLARTHTKEAVALLADAMKNATRLFGSDAIEHPDWRVKVTAADALLNRGHGTPYRMEQVQQSAGDQARLLSLQAQKLEAETRLLEQKIAEGNKTDVTVNAEGDDVIDQMMKDRFGGAQQYPTTGEH